MLNPIEFPEFHSDMRLQKQISELQEVNGKLKSSNNLLKGILIVFGLGFIFSLFYERSSIPYKLADDGRQTNDDQHEPMASS